jgi:hypothetical protein
MDSVDGVRAMIRKSVTASEKAAINKRVSDAIEEFRLRFEAAAFLKGNTVLYVHKPRLGGWCLAERDIPAAVAARAQTMGSA